MRISSVLFAVLIVVLVVSLLSVWFYPSVQDFMEGNTVWNGIRDFNDEFGAKGIDSLDDLPEMPEGAVLVTIPYLDYTDQALSRIKSFVDNGGMLLLMDDFGYGNHLLTFLNVAARFTNGLLLDPLFCYKNQRMPRITDFTPAVKDRGVNVVLFNHGTTLSNVSGANALAWSSGMSFLDSNQNERQDASEPNGPFVVAAEYRLGKGNIKLVADPSILINAMMGQDDNYSFIRYLAKGDPERIFIDHSHLSKTPLDVSKIRLNDARRVQANPYVLLGIVASIFAIITRYMLKKGEAIG